MVSAGAKAKAAAIGLSRGGQQGGLEGQARAKVMGRQVGVMRRWGYTWALPPSSDTNSVSASGAVKNEGPNNESAHSASIKLEDQSRPDREETEPALWALDPDLLAKLNGAPTFASVDHTGGIATDLPVFAPQSARAYILRSFESSNLANAPGNKEAGAIPSIKDEDVQTKIAQKPKTKAAVAQEKEQNLGALLKALDLVFESWSSVLSKPELDSKAWSWYLRIRPEVEDGVRGWGAKGTVKLADVLDLRRKI